MFGKYLEKVSISEKIISFTNKEEENIMTRMEELINLEKSSMVDVIYCDFIADVENTEENIRTRILKSRENGKYYYHQMQHGNVIKCFEIALSWVPFENVYVFNYTPDDLHKYEIDSRNPEKLDVKHLEEKQITENMSCNYDGMTVEYVNEIELKFNGKSVKIVKDDAYTYKMLKTKIRAAGGAKGLYIFLENIAEEGKNKYPLWGTVWRKMHKLYGM